MTPAENLQLLHRVLTVLTEADDRETLVLSPQKDGTISPWMICNDVFAWACADGESITLDNVGIFEQAGKDVMAADPRNTIRADPGYDIKDVLANMNMQLSSDIGILFACRVRKQKPFKHNDAYPVHKSVYPLIEAITDQETDMDKSWKDMGIIPS